MRFAPCRQCKAPKISVDSRGRLTAHRDVHENPCTGSHSVVPAGKIFEDSAVEALLGRTGITDHKPDLGMTVMGALNSEGPGSGAYPGSEPRKGWLSDRDPDDPQQAAQPYNETTVTFHGEEGELRLLVHMEGDVVPTIVSAADTAHTCMVVNDDSRICLRPKGAHEHQFVAKFEAPKAPAPEVGFPAPGRTPMTDAEAAYGNPSNNFLSGEHTPAEWSEWTGIQIMDPDGWRLGSKLGPQGLHIPITHDEFQQRAGESTTGPRQTVPTKQREGDQPLPVVNDRQDIQSMVIEDIQARREVGISRYGTALQPFNGRDPLQDLYEELMDALMYTKQVMVERDEGSSE